ncbi:hypothetical protein N7466_000611 [Penicillium verhagenii]|uniref:uncharacterized protein n=1 Tax=Penicillium verhagenii TaxID=1562060 RepID=UPI0025459F2C|nr:uncharacterized protein N7466_000611 [Penicillium verhagenii]KAJ5947596.1 hypothetical protein N7466_000611 [Penicillium verhagenii]
MPTDRDSDDKRDKRDSPDKPSDMPNNKDLDNESETNPFVAFRRFADEQVSSVLHSITGLPSSMGSPQSDGWTIFTDDKEYKNMAYRHRTGDKSNANNTAERDSTPNQSADPNTPDGEQDPPSHKSNNEQMSEPQQLSDIFRKDNIFAHPLLRSGPAIPDFLNLIPFTRVEEHAFEFTSRSPPPGMDENGMPNWPYPYASLSPYSPLLLERQPYHFTPNAQGVFSSIASSLQPTSDLDSDPPLPQWREAFEDLVRLENGKSMLEREPLLLSKIRSQNNSEWVYGVVQRGSFGDRYTYTPGGTLRHSLPGIVDHGPKDIKRQLPMDRVAARDNSQPESELELYERFLEDIQARERETSHDSVPSPMLSALFEKRREQDAVDEHQRQLTSDPEQGNDDTESWLDLVSGGNRKSVPETQPASQSASPFVVSTTTRTERVRHPDGSVEIKRVRTKRFEDGREETESFVDTMRPRQDTGEEQSSEQNPQSKNGWFWKD